MFEVIPRPRCIAVTSQIAELIQSLPTTVSDAVNPIKQLREVLARVAPGQPTIDVLIGAIGADELSPLVPPIVEKVT